MARARSSAAFKARCASLRLRPRDFGRCFVGGDGDGPRHAGDAGRFARAASRRAVASVRRFSTTVAVACTNSASWRASSLRRAGRADDRELGTGDGGGRGGGALLTGDRAFDEAGLRDTAAGDGLEAFWDRGGVLAGDRLFVDAWPFAGFFAAASAATAASRSATAASRSDKAASRRPKASAKAEASSPSVWPMPPSETGGFGTVSLGAGARGGRARRGFPSGASALNQTTHPSSLSTDTADRAGEYMYKEPRGWAAEAVPRPPQKASRGTRARRALSDAGEHDCRQLNT